MASVEEYVRSLPPITKYYLFSSLATTVLVTFKLLDPYYLYLDWSLVLHKFQIWRLVTNLLFFGTFSMNMVFQLVLLVRYFNMVESQYYNGVRGTADMIVMLAIGIGSLYTFSTFFSGFYFNGPAVVCTVNTVVHSARSTNDRQTNAVTPLGYIGVLHVVCVESQEPTPAG